jgi:hypothetical protein
MKVERHEEMVMRRLPCCRRNRAETLLILECAITATYDFNASRL